jgi:hypothetical protein
MTRGQVASAVAEALCVREQRCGEVGEGEQYDRFGACLADLEPDALEDVDADQCHGGISREGMQNCLARIRVTDCDVGAGWLESLDACAEDEICA